MSVDSVELNKLIKNYYKVKSDSVSAISKQLMENKDSVYQLLLPDIKNQVVLYIGNSSNNLLTVLASKCAKVIAIYTSDIEIEFITQKNQLVAPDITNIEYMPYQENIISELDLGKINGVILENNLDHLLKSNNRFRIDKTEGLLISLINKLNDNVWIFIKSEGLADRRILHLGELNKFFSRLKFLYTFNRLLISTGYIRNRYYGFDSIVMPVFDIVDMSNKAQVNQLAIKKKRWLKYFPYRLNRLILPVVGAFYSKCDNDDSLLTQIITKICDILMVSSYEVTNIEVNDKNKCVLYIELAGCEYEKIVVKIGLDEISTSHLLHHFKGLELLNNKVSENTLLSNCFPTPIYQGEFDDIKFIVESFLPGVPWRLTEFPTRNSELILKTINLIKSIYSLSVASIEGNRHIQGSGLHERVKYVVDFVRKKDLLMGKALSEFISPILEKEISLDHKYFYKSDFTVSNIILSEKSDFKLIDLDFWGVSNNKLLDFADFIISYSRCFYNRDLNFCIKAIMNNNLNAFPKELNIKNSLEVLESDLDTLKEAMILAWLNSIYHIIEFDKSRSNKKHMKKLLYTPLKTMLSLH